MNNNHEQQARTAKYCFLSSRSSMDREVSLSDEITFHSLTTSIAYRV